jgi:prepilin-type N-terminal cleavage/methylation domain-containing protein
MTVMERGFTLVELMITLIIMVILTTLSLITMRGYVPKQRLISTARNIEGTLMRAQSEAYSRATRAGVHFYVDSGGFGKGEIFLDNDTTGTDYQQDASEGALTTPMLFKPDIFFASNPCFSVYAGTAGCNATVGGGCYVFFDSSGQAINTTGATTDYEVFIYSSNLEYPQDPTKKEAREIEALAAGMVEVIKIGQPGNASGAHTAAACAHN